ATFGNFLEALDEMLNYMNAPHGDGVVLYMNASLGHRLNNLARRFAGQGGFSVSQDQLGRGIMSYKNAIIRYPGFKADQSTEIITATETATGADGASTFTSIYACRYTDGGVSGWAMQPL